jgi:hypothetical protein
MKHGDVWDMALIYSMYIPNTCLINSKYTYALIPVWYILIWLCDLDPNMLHDLQWQ